jgi:hypothetical protein
MISRVMSLIVTALYLWVAYQAKGRYQPFVWGRFFIVASVGLCVIWFADGLAAFADWRRDRPEGSSKAAVECLGWLLLLAPAAATLLMRLCMGLVLGGRRQV